MGTVNYDQSYRTTGGLQRFDCLAWVNFNGTGTVAIRASGNVSSITDNGTGDYTVNFTNALPDANYSVGGLVVLGTIGNRAGLELDTTGGFPSASAFRIRGYTASTAAADMTYVCLQVFR